MSNIQYWEVIADELAQCCWSWGYCSAVTRDGWRWIIDAHRGGRRYIVHSDDLLSAFLELEATLLSSRVNGCVKTPKVVPLVISS